MIRVDVVDGESTRTFTFSVPSVIVGTVDAELVLDASQIAQSRIRLTERAGAIVVEDVRGRHPSRTVETGAVLRLAKIELRVFVIDETEHGFLTELRAAPDSAPARSVYADWLEQRGQTARAEYLRSQLAAAAAKTPTEPAFLNAASRIRQLSRQVGDEWRADVGMVFVEHCPVSPNTPTYPSFDDGELGLELVCPMQWEKLSPTARDGVRACGVCNKEVTFCTSYRDVVSLVHSGKCVAVELSSSKSREQPGIVIGLPKPRRR